MNNERIWRKYRQMEHRRGFWEKLRWIQLHDIVRTWWEQKRTIFVGFDFEIVKFIFELSVSSCVTICGRSFQTLVALHFKSRFPMGRRGLTW